jgi:hypothetical protein
MENDNILERIDMALERMRAEGHDVDESGGPCEHYENLQAKRQAVADGQPHAIYSIAPYLITRVAAEIPDYNFKRDKDGNHELVKGRGNKEKAAINAVINNAHYREAN